MLVYLARHAGRVLDRNQILENVWGYSFDGESDTVKVYVRYLRKKLNLEGEPDLIHAVRGVGYMVREPREEQHDSEDPPPEDD